MVHNALTAVRIAVPRNIYQVPHKDFLRRTVVEESRVDKITTFYIHLRN